MSKSTTRVRVRLFGVDVAAVRETVDNAIERLMNAADRADGDVSFENAPGESLDDFVKRVEREIAEG